VADPGIGGPGSRPPPTLGDIIFFLTTQVTSHRQLDMRVTSVNQLAGQAELHMLQLFVQWDASVIKPVGLLRRGRLDVYVMTLITRPGPVKWTSS